VVPVGVGVVPVGVGVVPVGVGVVPVGVGVVVVGVAQEVSSKTATIKPLTRNQVILLFILLLP